MKTIFIAIFTLAFKHLFSQNLNFSRTYPSNSYADARYFANSNDNGFVMTGLDKNHEDSTGDMYAMKVNAFGGVIWKKYYGYPKEDGGNFILKSNNGGYLIVGHSNNTPDNECDGYLVKINEEGEKIWDLFLGTSLDDVCQGGVQAQDGSYYVTGRYEEQNGSHKFDLLLANISSDGKLNWLKNIPSELSLEGFRLALGTDQSILITGFGVNEKTNNEDIFAQKTDLNGNFIWQKTWDEKLNERAFFVIPSDEGSYIIGGAAFEDRYAKKGSYGILRKLDKNGNVLTEFKSFNSTFNKTIFLDAHLYGTNQMIVVGAQSENENPCIISFDMSLNPLNFKAFESIGNTRPNAILPINLNEFILTGKIDINSTLNIWLGRIKWNENLSLKSDDPNKSQLVSFPNPWNDSYYIYVDNAEEKNLEIYNNSGKLIKTITFNENDIFIYKRDLKIAGEYFFNIKLKNGKVIHNGRFIME
ncbi:MAG: T9SS type A sorting domain-containing protein [Saprospiraceae bacterium]